METSFLEKNAQLQHQKKEWPTYPPTATSSPPCSDRLCPVLQESRVQVKAYISISIYIYIKWRRQDTPTNLGFETIYSLSTFRIGNVAQGFRFIWLTTRVAIDRIKIRWPIQLLPIHWHVVMYCIQIPVQTKFKVASEQELRMPHTHTERERNQLSHIDGISKIASYINNNRKRTED